MACIKKSFVVVVQLLSCVQLFANPQTAAHQVSLSFTIPWSLLKLRSIELVKPSNHLCCPLLPVPSIFPRIRVFSNELAVHIRWPKYWSFNFRICPSNEYSGQYKHCNLPLSLFGLYHDHRTYKKMKMSIFKFSIENENSS